MKIYLATDHAGFELKESIKLFLEIEKEDIQRGMEETGRVISGIEIVDFGAYTYDENDDYPKYISACAGALSSDIYTGKKFGVAVVFGGSGEGEAIVAGKYKGIRAGVLNSENLELVRLMREHNNANVLSIGARFVGEAFAKEAIKAFILTKFIEKQEGEETRHKRRIEQIEDLENNMMDVKVTNTELEELEKFQDMKVLNNEEGDN